MILNFVLCPSYHGATLLALLLNNHTGISCLGDTIPHKTDIPVCACGSPVTRCAFWSEITKRINTQIFTGSEFLLPYYPRGYNHSKFKFIFNKALWAPNRTIKPWIWKLFGIQGAEYLNVYLRFYKNVCDIQGTSIFVDGQKNIMKVLLFKSMLGKKAQFRVIHLIRDPRGFFNSHKKYQDQPSVKTSAKNWVESHNRIRTIGANTHRFDYLPLRYEDLCAAPSEVMKEVFTFLGVENQDVCQSPLNPGKHHIIGNNMLTRFDGKIRLDTTWKERLTGSEQTQMIRLTRPLSAEYGYT